MNNHMYVEHLEHSLRPSTVPDTRVQPAPPRQKELWLAGAAALEKVAGAAALFPAAGDVAGPAAMRQGPGVA